MTRRARAALLVLVGVQACHSAEEYAGRLWEKLTPAAFVSGLFSSDRRVGFLIANASLIAFGVFCWAVARRATDAGRALAWVWVGLECANASTHTIWALLARAYRPGLATAPLLLASALVLARELRRDGRADRVRRAA
jgi:hypothetical protein